MATVVSHAMRRYPITSPDSEYSTYGFRGAASHRSWSPIETTESSLAHSMRYAEPWLYGSVRASRGLVLAPALVLCSCTDYINGTKRSNKKSPTVCKKCKGTRIPLSNVEQFGTLRCFPTAPSASVAGSIRGGTVRVSSKSRPSILTSGDPYDLMRRSRLSVSESTSQFRARSVSPNKIRSNESRSSSATRAKSHTPPSKYSTVSRKSILECSVNPYDLLNSESEPKDSSITLVSGQRIRTRPQNAETEYEDVQIRRPQSSSVKNENNRNLVKSAPPTLKSNEKESECNRFKSILKKPTTTFSDTDLSGGLERSPSPVVKSGSHFYLPMPANAPRKKVQFLVENELVSCSVNGQSCEDTSHDNEYETVSVAEPPKKSKSSDYEENSTRNALTRANSCKLRRSISERVSQEASKVVFNDTMALRSRPVRSDFREIFTSKDLRTLDGIATAAALQAFDKHRPRGPPPQPPRDKTAVAKSKDSDTKYYDCKRYGAQKPVSANNATETPKKKEAGNTECVKKREAESKSSIVLIENVPIVEEVSSELLNIEVKHEEDIPDDMKSDVMEIKGDDVVQHSISNKSTDVCNSSEGPNIPTSENETNLKNADIQKLSVSLTVNGTVNPQPNTNQNVPIDNTDAKLMINVKSLSEPKIRITSLNTAKDDQMEVPPSAPPRKRSNNKPVMINGPNIQLEMESPTSISNKTIVKINSTMNATVHKLKIKNECPDPTFNAMSMPDRNQGKTSIMINGDDCYCTVNVSDDVPLYQSSVVVKDSGMKIETNERKSSSVYITGNFVNHVLPVEALNTKTPAQHEVAKLDNFEPDSIMINTKINDEPANNTNNVDDSVKESNPSELCSTEMLQQILNDPVEAVRRNLVPHVCGKTDVLKRPRGRKKMPTDDIVANFLNDSMLSSVTDFQVNPVSQLIEESFLKLRNHDMHADDDKDTCSEHSSSTQYEIMDPGSDCYTDNSNRSSVTEEEMSARSKFYELLAESAVEVSESEDHHYESIRPNVDPIYEEIEIPPPLPANPPPASLLDDLQLDKEYTTRSIFEGASKYDILSYLVDAKERGIVPEDSYTYNFNNSGIVVEEDGKENAETFNRVSQLSTVSDSSEDSSLVISGALIEDKVQRSIDIERNDSGVGSETSKSSLKKYRSKNELTVTCEDCEGPVDLLVENEPLICRKCAKRRSERKEIITEIVETEEKYSRDLQIILEEFYQPMLVAGLLTSEQLSAIFLNVEELLENSQALAERLRDAVEIAVEQGDEDLLTVNIGKLFLEAAPMLHAFETYCVRQGAASLLLASLEKEKELLRIFLRVSQMENTVLRRMNLNSFLMVPVQRVTKYPLLLARLYKVTPVHHETREQLKESQHKIELHLNHMNSETKDVPSKLWRRISNNPGRRSSSEMDLVNIKLRKIAVDVLEWNHEEAKFALEGKLLFTQPTDNNWRKGRTIKLAPVNALLVTNGKVSNVNRPDSSADSLIFSRHSGVREAALLLVRDKNGRYSLLREPLYLDRCVIAADPAWQSYFEVQELLGKDTFIFKAEDEDQTKIWYRNLQYYAQGMGAWRKRRNALANIMINGMGLRS